MIDTNIAKKIVLLRKNKGKVLSPTPDAYDFSDYLAKLVKCSDFAKHGIDYKYQTIIGIIPLNHIRKCIEHLDKKGELIVYSSKLPSDVTLCNYLHKIGTITDVIHEGDHVIWRFAKDDMTHKTMVDGSWKYFTLMDDQMMFLSKDYCVPFTDLFTIRVGAISGLDEAFINKKGNAEFVTSQTPQTGLTKRMFFNCFDESMVKFKKKLLARRVKKFNEGNWWTWGRGHFVSDQPRVYVPCKTKQIAPFFHHDSTYYDGTILSVFFKGKAKPSKVVALLNKVDWTELGFKVGKRYIFSQKSLESIKLPKEFLTICV